jgi:spore maturation protein CgeB
MKKVLLIKLEAPSYSSIGMETAFREAYEEVRSINWQQLRFDNGYNGLKVIWEIILNECETFKPDLIFVQLQVDYILTTEQFKELGKRAFVINFTEDVREDIKWMEDAAPHIGLTIFTNMDDVEKLSAKGINNVAYMMVSYNDVWYKPQEKTSKDYGEIIFIGNNFVNTNLNFPQAQERQDMIKFMKEKFGDRFQAYGIGQENSILLPMQCVEAYNNCRVAITHNNFKRNGYCSDRNFNSMACGAFTVQQHFEGMEEMFKDAPYLASWKDFDSLETLCNFYLYDAIENKKEMTDYIKQNHDWRNRIRFIRAALILMDKGEFVSALN